MMYAGDGIPLDIPSSRDLFLRFSLVVSYLRRDKDITHVFTEYFELSKLVCLHTKKDKSNTPNELF